jgi:hypothetical protein
MNSFYEEWLQSGQNWMKAYRKQLLKKCICFIIPAVVFVLAVVGAGATAVNYGSTEEIMDSAFVGALVGAMICFVFILFLLPGVNPKRMNRSMKRAVKLLDMSEVEQEQFGREMLEAEKQPARVLDYRIEVPNSKSTPARFILSPKYACLWGSYPLVILVRLSDIAYVRTEEECKTAMTRGATSDTIHRFNLHTITFYYKGSNRDGDNGMGFFSEAIRDKVFGMIEAQRGNSAVYEKGEPENVFWDANGSFPNEKVHRVINVEISSGESIKNILYKDINTFVVLIEEGREDYLILNSHDGFLQFYGVDNQFIMEMRINLQNNDFRTYSIINRDKEHLVEKVQFTTPFGQFTPREREVISLELVKTVIKKYYENIDEKNLLNEIPYIETTEEIKRCMGLIK